MNSSLQDYKTLADIYQAICIGTAALISVIKFTPEIIKAYKRNTKISQFRKMYPHSDLHKTYELIRDPNRLPVYHVYVIDKRTNTKRHVENPQTMIDLEFDFGEVGDITKEQYKSFPLDKKIDTTVN